MIRVAAVQSGGLEVPRPAAAVVQAKGVWRGPENTGPSAEWFTTVSDAEDPPTDATSLVVPVNPVTRPSTVPVGSATTGSLRSNCLVTSCPPAVTFSPEGVAGAREVAPLTLTRTSTWPPLT